MTPRSAVAVHCYVRAASLVAPVDATVERLREFDRTEVIDELRIEAWPDEVPLEGESEHATILGRFEAFQDWADRLGASLEPAFAVRELTTLVADESEAVLVLPVVCLAIHVDGRLASVVPHLEGGTAYTVDDALADLEALDYAAPTAADRVPEGPQPGVSSDARAPEQCPACLAGLETGQGLYACPSCAWVGVDPAEGRTTTQVSDTSQDGEADGPDPVESETGRPDERPPQPPT